MTWWKKTIGYTIAFIYLGLVFGGIHYLLDFETRSKAIMLFGTALVTTLVALFLRDDYLKKGFIIVSFLMANGAIIYGWGEFENVIKAAVYGILVIEALVILIKVYKKIGGGQSYSYTGRVDGGGSGGGPNVNIVEFCKAKYIEKNDMDACINKLLNKD